MDKARPVVGRRNLTVELMRLLFMALIMMLHFIIHGRGYVSHGYDSVTGSPGDVVEMSLIMLCQLGVTGFMFISGYYGIRFRAERLFSLWMQGAFYCLVLALAAWYVSKEFHPLALSKFFMPFSNGGWWFVGAYALIFLLSPIINAGLEAVGRSTLRWILILFGLYLYVGCFIGERLSTTFQLLLFIYILGRYVSKYPIKWIEKNPMTIAVSGCVLMVSVVAVLTVAHQHRLMSMMFSNYNPLVLVTSCSLCMWAVKRVVVVKSAWIYSLLSNVLAAYLISDYTLLREALIEKFGVAHFSLLAGFVCVIVILVACLLIEEVRKRAMNPLGDRFFTLIKNKRLKKF